jgi:OOP family OmpA-OmpF porin
MKHLLTGILALLALTACDTTASLKDLRVAEPHSDPYFSTLASLYQDYAESELTAYDWWSSKYFADKGLLTAYGKEITPENPDHWDISEGEKRTLRAAREVLMASLTPAMKQKRPRAAAKAVMYYDCWVENQEEGWETEQIETCRDAFYNNLGKLEDSETAQADDEQTTATAPVETTSSILYFPFDDDALTDLALAALNELIDYVKSTDNAKVVLNGHADRAGTDGYNFTLSERRARFILDKLLAAGIDPGRISYFAFGETDPEVPTDDGVKEPANRRVEIFIE